MAKKPKRKPLKTFKPKLATIDTSKLKPTAKPKRKKFPDRSYDV